jgi:hypothetical protein
MLRDNDTRQFIKWQINEEAIYREVLKTDEHKYFFDWNLPQENKLKSRFHSLISEGFLAANELMIGMDYDDESNKILL